jgi:hypothetical protein
MSHRNNIVNNITAKIIYTEQQYSDEVEIANVYCYS